MNLQNVWFCLIAVLWAGYFVLEGFDFGVGMLLPFVPRDEDERGAMFESIGPVWDGNEVWLVVAGGATFAAFPAWYGTMFSGFYLALLLVLVCLIVRVVSFEWREKSPTTRWRSTWRWANTVGSIGAPFVWGVALDPGTRRIGVAVSDETGLIATPVAVLERSTRRRDLERVRALIDKGSFKDAGQLLSSVTDPAPAVLALHASLFRRLGGVDQAAVRNGLVDSAPAGAYSSVG